MLQELKLPKPEKQFREVTGRVTEMEVWNYWDTSFIITAGRDYGQTAIVTGLAIKSDNGHRLFHLIDWHSRSQRRVSHSFYGGEILACVDADDCSFYLKQTMNTIENKRKIRNILHVDQRGLYDTTTTFYRGKEYRLRQTVQIIRDFFEDCEIDILRLVEAPPI